jgi:apolipoprotein N-acyltransferase
MRLNVIKTANYLNRACPRVGDGLVLLAGLLMPLGFAPIEWRFMPFLSLALLLFLLDVETLRRAFWRGFVFGLGMFGFGVSWVYNSLHDYGAASVYLSAIIAAGLVLICALYTGGFGILARRWSSRLPRLAVLLVVPAVWVLTEWLRSWLFTGFPWLLLGYSQVDTWLGNYAVFGGALSVSFVIALTAAAIVLMISAAPVRRYLLAGIVIATWGLAWLSGLAQWIQPAGEPIRVSLVQGNVPQELKLRPEKLALTLDHYHGLSRAYYHSDLIIWPETAIPAFRHRIEGFLQGLDSELKEHDTDLLTGAFIYDFERERYYNSVFKVGHPDAVYHKKHLVPFGEYMPLRGLLEFMNRYINIPMSDIDAGEIAIPIRLAGYPAAVSICYESAYIDVYREQLPAAAFLINVSNDAWFGNSLAPHQHLEIARMRALEAGRYLLRATNTGISAIIGPDGRVLARSPQFEVAVLNGEILPMQGITPFIRAGHWPILLIVMFILILAEVYSRRAWKNGG